MFLCWNIIDEQDDIAPEVAKAVSDVIAVFSQCDEDQDNLITNDEFVSAVGSLHLSFCSDCILRAKDSEFLWMRFLNISRVF